MWPPQDPATMSTSIPENKMTSIQQALFGGDRFKAISVYQQCTGARYAEAKSEIEKLERDLRLASPKSFDVPPNRRQALVMGIVCILASACVFTLVILHKLHPEAYAHPRRPLGKDIMPDWMALGVAALFGMVGVGALISPILKSNRFAKQIQGLVGGLILGFFAAIPFYAIFIGADWVHIPFISERWNHILGQAAFGLLGVMLSAFTVILIVSPIPNWRNPK